MPDIVLRGRVRSTPADAGVAQARVVVTSKGAVLGSANVGADGAFDVRVPAGEDLVVTVLGEDHRALRLRPVVGRGEPMGRDELVDLGELDVPVAEFPPGISGKAWDTYDDKPAVGGVATLRRGSVIVGTDRIDSNGDFAIEMTADRLLPGGTYQLVVEVPGYKPGEQVVEVGDDVTSYRVGRVDLSRLTRD